jgi:hypothetical protein
MAVSTIPPESATQLRSNSSRVVGDKRTESIEPRSGLPDASVDPTDARSVIRFGSDDDAGRQGGDRER